MRGCSGGRAFSSAGRTSPSAPRRSRRPACRLGSSVAMSRPACSRSSSRRRTRRFSTSSVARSTFGRPSTGWPRRSGTGSCGRACSIVRERGVGRRAAHLRGHLVGRAGDRLPGRAAARADRRPRPRHPAQRRAPHARVISRARARRATRLPPGPLGRARRDRLRGADARRARVRDRARRRGGAAGRGGARPADAPTSSAHARARTGAGERPALPDEHPALGTPTPSRCGTPVAIAVLAGANLFKFGPLLGELLAEGTLDELSPSAQLGADSVSHRARASLPIP